MNLALVDMIFAEEADGSMELYNSSGMVGGRKLYVGGRSFDAVISSCRIGSNCLGVVVYVEGKIRFR